MSRNSPRLTFEGTRDMMTRHTARELATNYRIPLDSDFHTLGASQVESIIAAADSVKYRAPKLRNGSRARYFHAYLRRAANRPA